MGCLQMCNDGSQGNTAETAKQAEKCKPAH